MRFQTKMSVTYAVFILIVGVAITFFYNRYIVAEYRKTEEKNLEIAAGQAASQIDELIKPMETRSRYILSDPLILESIKFLASPPPGEANAGYMENARATVQAGLLLDYVMNSFYRVVLFNPAGSVISSRITPPVLTQTVTEYEQMPWLTAVDAAKGKPVLVPAHEDIWGINYRPQVFSLIRAIQGGNMGYIEVQRTVDSIAEAIVMPKHNLRVVVLLGNGEPLYANTDGIDFTAYFNALQIGKTAFEAHISGRRELIAVSRSSYGAIVVVAEAMEDVERASSSVAPITIAIVSIFSAISVAFVIIASRFLTKPLRVLRVVMEQTRLENLGHEINVVMPNNELEALNLSYQSVLERLRESIVKEKQASLLQIQAQFDLLQAQVNPHFLYNVLNVISQRGAENDDEVICDMCSSLAAMLRYSTNTKIRYASIEQELRYLEQYFYLLKSRYKHKLSYSIEVDKGIHEQVIPKIVLQQIVENSVNHGFANAVDNMNIRIIGLIEDNRWVLLVRDNGQGIEDSKLKEIFDKLMGTKARIVRDRSNVELEIGGMGISNTYARLYLKFGDDLDFVIRNREKGTEVLISATIAKGVGDDV
jgi:two-component system sensor histidine kinase YesM